MSSDYGRRCNQVESLDQWRPRLATPALDAMSTQPTTLEPATIEAIAELTLRLSRVMRPG